MTFDEIEIDRTAARLAYLAGHFEETAYNLRKKLDANDAVPTAQQANWLEFLLNYSETLRHYSSEAYRISAI